MRDFSIISDRKRFERALSKFGHNAGVAPEISTLRVEVALENGNGRYVFDPKKSDKSVTERTLDRNDVFVVLGWGIFPWVTKDSVDPLLTYGYKQALANADFKGFKTSDIEALYHGTMSLKTQQTLDISNYPVILNRHVPVTQPAYTLDSDNGLVSVGLQPEFDVLASLVELAPEITLAGTQDVKIEVNFPTKPAFDFAAKDAGYSTYLVWQAIGYLVKGGSQYIKTGLSQD